MKKYILSLLFISFGAVHSSAQLPKWALDLAQRSEKSDTVSAPLMSYLDAVLPALSIVRQQYRLERNGESYGRNKKAYYGETYSLGVKVSGGTILMRNVIYPWENDADYQRVNSSGKYKPTYFYSMQRPIYENTWKPVELELNTQYVTPITADSSLFKHTDTMSDFGLPTDETPGSKQGYLIWAYSETSLQDSAMQVKLLQTEMKTNAQGDANAVAVHPEGISNVLGGIYVVPIVERAGYIKLMLVGMAVKKSANDWQLRLLTNGSSELTKVDGATKDDKKHKKKKSSEHGVVTPTMATDDSEPTPIK